jgi:hypothetical protein
VYSWGSLRSLSYPGGIRGSHPSKWPICAHTYPLPTLWDINVSHLPQGGFAGSKITKGLATLSFSMCRIAHYRVPHLSIPIMANLVSRKISFYANIVIYTKVNAKFSFSQNVHFRKYLQKNLTKFFKNSFHLVSSFTRKLFSLFS